MNVLKLETNDLLQDDYEIRIKLKTGNLVAKRYEWLQTMYTRLASSFQSSQLYRNYNITKEFAGWFYSLSVLASLSLIELLNIRENYTYLLGKPKRRWTWLGCREEPFSRIQGTVWRREW